MTWSECDGPKVMPPPRRGLGTRPIERQIFCELDGTSDVDFAADDLAVTMHIPRLQTAVSEKVEGTDT